MTYPPGGRYTINTEDFLCLAEDEFLNDAIIEFYIHYFINNLPPKKKDKVHVFSTFFYNHLNSNQANEKEESPTFPNDLSVYEKRHARVKKWTKNVNIFEKDYIIIPLNEDLHWFLAIICFPGLDKPVLFESNCLTTSERKKTPIKQ